MPVGKNAHHQGISVNASIQAKIVMRKKTAIRVVRVSSHRG